MVFFNLICGAMVGSIVVLGLSSCWFGPFYGTFFLAGLPTFLFLIFPPRMVFQYCLGLGLSFALASLVIGTIWPIPTYGIIFGAAAFTLRLILELMDQIFGDNLPIAARSPAPFENITQQKIESAPILT